MGDNLLLWVRSLIQVLGKGKRHKFLGPEAKTAFSILAGFAQGLDRLSQFRSRAHTWAAGSIWSACLREATNQCETSIFFLFPTPFFYPLHPLKKKKSMEKNKRRVKSKKKLPLAQNNLHTRGTSWGDLFGTPCLSSSTLLTCRTTALNKSCDPTV